MVWKIKGGRGIPPLFPPQRSTATCSILSETEDKKMNRKTPKKSSPKQRIGILFGGRSGEHEVSLLSAASILKAIDKKKYDVVPIGITKQGRWVTSHDAQALLAGKFPAENPRLAGDPEATPTAAVLKRGDEAIIIPPVPAESLQPFESGAPSIAASSRWVGM